jgi:hypothetical protein
MEPTNGGKGHPEQVDLVMMALRSTKRREPKAAAVVIRNMLRWKKVALLLLGLPEAYLRGTQE